MEALRSREMVPSRTTPFRPVELMIRMVLVAVTFQTEQLHES
jgi:hypothetical protein